MDHQRDLSPGTLPCPRHAAPPKRICITKIKEIKENANKPSRRILPANQCMNDSIITSAEVCGSRRALALSAGVRRARPPVPKHALPLIGIWFFQSSAAMFVRANEPRARQTPLVRTERHGSCQQGLLVVVLLFLPFFQPGYFRKLRHKHDNESTRINVHHAQARSHCKDGSSREVILEPKQGQAGMDISFRPDSANE